MLIVTKAENERLKRELQEMTNASNVAHSLGISPEG